MNFAEHTFLTGVELGRQTYSNQIGQTAFTSINMFAPVYGTGVVPATLPTTTLVHSFANAAGGYVQDQVDVMDKLHILIGARGGLLLSKYQQLWCHHESRKLWVQSAHRCDVSASDAGGYLRQCDAGLCAGLRCERICDQQFYPPDGDWI